jgi:CHAT domain-containing protein/tetratricopeptide (TPR) repeat protein
MKRAFAAKVHGDVREAHRLFSEGEAWCRRHGYRLAALRFRVTATSIRYLAGDYRAAAKEYLDEEREARELSDIEEGGAIRSNLASLYLEMNDGESAAHAAESALRELGRAEPYPKPYLLLILASIYSQRGAKAEAEELFAEALTLSVTMDLPDVALAGWDRLGAEKLRSGDLAAAGQCFAESFRYRKLHRPADLATSYLKIGDWEVARRQFSGALRFTNLALAAGPSLNAPTQFIHHTSGNAKLALGDLEGALADFDTALKLSAVWRDEALPVDALRTHSNAAVQDMYDSYVDAAMRLYRGTGRLKYVRSAWEALEGNRAASLRRTLGDSGVWRNRLPPEYWSKLAALRQALIASRGALDSKSPEARRVGELQTDLLAMEARAVVGPSIPVPFEDHRTYSISPKFSENTTARFSLTTLQRHLTGARVLISFQLGEKVSYRWTVTKEGASIWMLPPRNVLTRLVADFESAIRNGDRRSISVGRRLYTELFAGLPDRAEAAHAWLLSLDDALFDVPFSALVAGRNGSRPVYLTQRHSIEIVPGAWAVGESYKEPGLFAGIADPVYNTADPRSIERRPVTASFRLQARDREMELSRLPGTREEIESCAREYGRAALLLSGWDASSRGLERALSGNPAVIHLATHVVPDPKNGVEALIILSNNASGVIDAVTARDIAALRVPGSLVVMSGCGSGRGLALPGAGLLGLDRAWLAAGARGVIASHWPVADDSGSFFQAFYRHFREENSGPARPAEALRRAREDMILAGGPLAEPRYWAAYEFVGRSN